MGLNGHKKVGLGVGIASVFGAVALVVGFYNDIIDIFSKKDDKSQEVVVTPIVTQEETQAVPKVEQTEEEVITTTEEITEPPVTEPSVVYLANLEPVEKKSVFGNGYYKSNEIEKDTIGNIYSGNVICTTKADGYCVYYLGGKYKKLSGVIAVNDVDSDAEETMIINILCDDTVMYENEMGRTSIPTEFSVNIENCQWLKIQNKGETINFILYNWKLE